MGCRCSERAQAIADAAVALANGDVETVKEAASFVLRTAREDAAAGLAKARAAASRRLGAGRR